jgi:hypothetical protein
MTIVRVLVDAVGDYNAGDIVHDAPPGLVHMAKAKTRNAATGELVAEFVADTLAADTPEVDEALLARAKELKISKADKMDNEQLTAAISEAEAEATAEEELKALKAKAKALKIEKYGQMDAEQLKTAIVAAEAAANGGGDGGE